MLNRRTLLSSAIPTAIIAPAFAGQASAASPDERWADRQIAELTALAVRAERTRLEGKLSIVSSLLSSLVAVDPEFDHITPDEWDREILPRLEALEAELRRRSDRARGRSV